MEKRNPRKVHEKETLNLRLKSSSIPKGDHSRVHYPPLLLLFRKTLANLALKTDEETKDDDDDDDDASKKLNKNIWFFNKYCCFLGKITVLPINKYTPNN